MTRHGATSFTRALALMRKHDPQLQEDGFHAAQQHAAEKLPQLIAELEAESRDLGLRRWLLDLIGDADSPSAIPVLARHLEDPDESLRSAAVRGLRRLDTREARHLLWKAGLGGH